MSVKEISGIEEIISKVGGNRAVAGHIALLMSVIQQIETGAVKDGQFDKEVAERNISYLRSLGLYTD
ncbi:hypothetical protein A2872_00530 [Candidatus Gottesmanbacteria bacterium RIFCSPHIGHO2_01_FULL_42_12]|uniref:Uncharacterized protein n=1 Tax=Candidatus Gottesmanbacteria bacterium RIFCSPHIGHO2_01_FULL_42_12 TaxID=1798377 RepID=A0A1F5Z363_9BACT|nr:MAG: hypothetical protein A2872_00530 [Candidatus Gottesmanbacteria bacterium RIFCSPHIGHO2_01_FULL_42_12]